MSPSLEAGKPRANLGDAKWSGALGWRWGGWEGCGQASGSRVGLESPAE